MPVPNLITDLSQTASSNSPAGTEPIGTNANEYIQAAFAFIRKVYDGVIVPLADLDFNGKKITNVASATISPTSTDVVIGKQLVDQVLTSGTTATTQTQGNNSTKLSTTAYTDVGLATKLNLSGGSMTGQILLKEGSAAVPGLSFVNDGAPDTGLYHISDGVFGITCNAVPVAKYGVNSIYQYGTLTQQAFGSNGTQRRLFSGLQSNGADRLAIGLDSDERPVLWTYNTSGTFDGSVHFGSGNVIADGVISGSNVTATSDERLKTDWKDVDQDFIKNWASVKHGTYKRLDTGEIQLGLSAQSVQSVVPEAVIELSNGYLALNYGGASAVATIKLAQEVLSLKEELLQQKFLIAKLFSKLEGK